MTRSRTLLGLAAAALTIAAAPAHAVLTSTSPACTVSILAPAYAACGGSFDGNNQNQEADVQAFIFGAFGQSFMNQVSSNDIGFVPFMSDPGSLTGTLTFDTTIDGPFLRICRTQRSIPA